MHVVQATDDRDTDIEEISQRFPRTSPEDIAATPFALIGTPDQMAAQLRAQARNFGITSYVVREPAVPDLERILPLRTN